jgi:hypothetical protein
VIALAPAIAFAVCQPVDPSGRESAARGARAKIMRVQRECEALPSGERMEESPPVKHWFSPGLYCREIHLKADTLVVGRIHLHEHFNVISKGCVTVFDEFDGEQTLEAHSSFISKAGTKRVVVTHEDAIWTTFHPNPTNETDLKKLEAMFTADEYAQLGMVVGEELEVLL